MSTSILEETVSSSPIMDSTSSSHYTAGDNGGASSDHDPSVMSPEEMERLSFLAYGTVGPLIIAVGLLGNCLALITFLGKTPIWSNGATTTYLKWLAITDTGKFKTAVDETILSVFILILFTLERKYAKIIDSQSVQ